MDDGSARSLRRPGAAARPGDWHGRRGKVRQITTTLRDLDNRLDGVLAPSAILAQTNTVLNHLKTDTYAETVGAALFPAAGNLAGVAAWSLFDSGHHASTQRTFLHAAAEGRDKRLGAHILGTVRSRRIADRLGELYEEVEPFAETPLGRDLREQVHDHLTRAR
ncbi:hypothetical protein ACIG54_07110 [Streptomyces achromogenes]|uniref:hypothetical protein n=1 Tax=Streptomyces achromogenes TaxID=67255 RepID=UPI0037D1288E